MVRDILRKVSLDDESIQAPIEGGPESAGQSGDTQGLSQAVDVAEESVEELAEEGQDFEAGILKGVEAATDNPSAPVPNHRGKR